MQVCELFVFDDLARVQLEQIPAGDVWVVVGLDSSDIGDTISDPYDPQSLGRPIPDNAGRHDHVRCCRVRTCVIPAHRPPSSLQAVKSRGIPASGALDVTHMTNRGSYFQS